LGHGPLTVLKYCQAEKAASAETGINKAKTKRELKTAKKMPPKGDTKKATTPRNDKIPVTVGPISLSFFPGGKLYICSRVDDDGAEKADEEGRGVVVVVDVVMELREKAACFCVTSALLLTEGTNAEHWSHRQQKERIATIAVRRDNIIVIVLLIVIVRSVVRILLLLLLWVSGSVVSTKRSFVIDLRPNKNCEHLSLFNFKTRLDSDE
jgi:hypothetical protein